LLADGEGDPLSKIRRSSESPRNLFSDSKQARRLLAAIKTFDTELIAVVEQARATEPKEEFDKIVRAVGAVVVEVDQHLISPTVRKHPELLEEPEFKKL
jgi:hypothetical protein